MELSQSQQSHDSDHVGAELVNTSDSDNESEARLGRDVNLAAVLGLNKTLITFLKFIWRNMRDNVRRNIVIISVI